jgi:predicted transcriptional regulator
MQRLSQLEKHALWALWHYPTGGIVAQVRGYLSRPLPYTTLASGLYQLVHKEYALHYKRGRQHWCSACVKQEAYGQHELTQLVATYFHRLDGILRASRVPNAVGGGSDPTGGGKLACKARPSADHPAV